MKAADLNKRRKLASLLLGGLLIGGQRPSFAAEGGLVVCQVQAGDSFKASFKVRGVFVEILEPENAASGAECAGYRDSGLRFAAGHRTPAFIFQSLQIIRGEAVYRLTAKSLINREESKFEERFESYAGARAAALGWVRGCLVETGELDAGEPEGEAQPISFSFSPQRSNRAHIWMDERERRALAGEGDASEEAQGVKVD